MRILLSLVLAFLLAACSPREAEDAPTVACGMLQLLWEIDEDAINNSYLEAIEHDVRRELLRNDLGYRDLGVEGGILQFQIWRPEDRETAQELVQTFQTTIDANGNTTLFIDWADDGRATISLTETYLQHVISRAIPRHINFMRRRLGEMFIEGATIEQFGDSQILLTAPSDLPPRRIFRHYWGPARLEFRMVDSSVSVETAMTGQVPPGSEVLSTNLEGERYALVRRRSLIDGDHIIGVDVSRSFWRRKPVVTIQFDYRGTAALSRITEDQKGQSLAIILSDVVISRVPITEQIDDGRIEIRELSTMSEAEDLADLLQSGEVILPVRLVQESRTPDCDEEQVDG